MILVDSYSESNWSGGSGDWGLYPANVIGIGQAFTGTGVNIERALFYLKRLGSPTGTAVAKLYAHTGTFGTSSKPVGSPLAVSDAFDVTLIGTSYALITFMFSKSQQYTLVNGTKYVIALIYSGTDISNNITAAADDSAPSHAGNDSFLQGSNWNTDGEDLCFYVYGVTSDISVLSRQTAFVTRY